MHTQKSMSNKKFRGDRHCWQCHDDNTTVLITILISWNKQRTNRYLCLAELPRHNLQTNHNHIYFVNENDCKNCVNCFHCSLQCCDIHNKHCFTQTMFFTAKTQHCIRSFISKRSSKGSWNKFPKISQCSSEENVCCYYCSFISIKGHSHL